MTSKRYSAAYIIAFHFGEDLAEMAGRRYQPTRYTAPAIYVFGDDYYCCPSGSQKPPRDRDFPDSDRWDWQPIGTYYGRTVYEAKCK